jgi:hypothetical protein
MSMESTLQEINQIKKLCTNHANEMARSGYREASTTLLMELSGIDADIRRAEDLLTKAYLKSDKIRSKWKIL